MSSVYLVEGAVKVSSSRKLQLVTIVIDAEPSNRSQLGRNMCSCCVQTWSFNSSHQMEEALAVNLRG